MSREANPYDLRLLPGKESQMKRKRLNDLYRQALFHAVDDAVDSINKAMQEDENEWERVDALMEEIEHIG